MYDNFYNFYFKEAVKSKLWEELQEVDHSTGIVLVRPHGKAILDSAAKRYLTQELIIPDHFLNNKIYRGLKKKDFQGQEWNLELMKITSIFYDPSQDHLKDMGQKILLYFIEEWADAILQEKIKYDNHGKYKYLGTDFNIVLSKLVKNNNKLYCTVKFEFYQDGEILPRTLLMFRPL